MAAVSPPSTPPPRPLLPPLIDDGSRARAPQVGLIWRFLRPRHTIWPTRDGKWCIFVVIGLGVAAVNTGNNLLYLLVSLLLSLIIVSGMLSELSMRGIELVGAEPDELFAGRPALFGLSIANGKRWFTSYSITVEVLSPTSSTRFLYVPRLDAGAQRLLTWEDTLPHRGRQRLAGVRITTRFPFGLFFKSGRSLLESEVIVYPAIRSLAPEVMRQLGAAGDRSIRRRGRGSDLYDLRLYRVGDDPRLIHWRSSAKTQNLTVRELEAETTEDARLVLLGTGARSSEALEAGLSEAASIAAHLIRSGAGVELVGPGFYVKLGRGPGHLRSLLTALALYDPRVTPLAPTASEHAGGTSGPMRQIRVRLG